MEVVRLLLARGAGVNAKNNVSTCECTDVSVSYLSICLSICLSTCLCLVLLVCMLLLSIIICTLRGLFVAMLLIPVMVGWGDRKEGLVL